MGEHTDNPENPQTAQDSTASVNPQSSTMPQGTSTGATVNAPGGAHGSADHSLGPEAAHGAAQPGPQSPHPEQPLPPQYPPWPYAPPPGYPSGPGEYHTVSSGQGYPNENPSHRVYDHGYPPHAPMPPLYAQAPSPYGQTLPPYNYAPYPPPSYPPGNPGVSQAPPQGGSADRPDINQLINGIANGDSNSLSSLGQIMNFDDKEFWKGALIGAAAVLLLTNDSVQRSLFRAGSKATQAVKSGMEKVKTAAGEEPKGSDNEQASDK